LNLQLEDSRKLAHPEYVELQTLRKFKAAFDIRPNCRTATEITQTQTIYTLEKQVERLEQDLRIAKSNRMNIFELIDKKSYEKLLSEKHILLEGLNKIINLFKENYPAYDCCIKKDSVHYFQCEKDNTCRYNKEACFYYLAKQTKEMVGQQ